MNNAVQNIYKSIKGRKEVESVYKNILSNYSHHTYKQLFLAPAGRRTHVLMFGEKHKPPLILIHGTASNSASWLGSISDFINDFCVYCVDIPGETGLSEPIRKPLASESPYNWLNALLDELNIKSASFVTISLGSWYALNLAIHNPDRVKALSMITTPGIVPAKQWFIAKAVFFMMLGKTGQKMMNKAIYHKTVVPREVLDFQLVVSRNFIPLMEKIPVFKDEQLQNILSPLQFFGGDHDALINTKKTGQRLKKLLPASDIHILEDTGHVIINQFPVIKKFLLNNINKRNYENKE